MTLEHVSLDVVDVLGLEHTLGALVFAALVVLELHVLLEIVVRLTSMLAQGTLERLDRRVLVEHVLAQVVAGDACHVAHRTFELVHFSKLN